MTAKQIRPRLERALEAFETGELDAIVREKRPDDFEALRGLAAGGAGVDPEHRQRAIYALGRWGDPSVVPELAAALPELEEPARITALDALGRLGTDEARRAVETCADDPSPQVRKFVVKALRRIGGPEADAALRRLSRRDEADWIRGLAREALEAGETGK